VSCNLGEGEGVDIQEAIDTETWEGRKSETFEDVSDRTEACLWFKVVL